jgi:hypothetical protein
MQGSNLDEAAAEAREALRIFPRHSSAKIQLGIALARNRRYEEAIPALRDALAAAPTMPPVQRFLGISLLETGKVPEALGLLNSYVAADPSDAEGHYFLGVALRAQKRSDEAHNQFLEALRLSPGNPQFAVAANPNAVQEAPDASSGPKPDEGSITENIYKNEFFGFTYEFPKGWMPLSKDAAKGVLEMGSNLTSTGDPIEQDAKQVALKKSYTLLFVMAGKTQNQMPGMNSVQIRAMDARNVPSLTVDAVLQGVAEGVQKSGAGQVTGPVESMQLGGRTFRKVTLTLKNGGATTYGEELLTIDKGFVVFIMLNSPDQDTLTKIEQSLRSIRFLDQSN